MSFRAGDIVIYPPDGLGEVQGVEELSVAGKSLNVIIIAFENGTIVRRITASDARAAGLRKFDRRIDSQKNLPSISHKFQHAKSENDSKKINNQTSIIHDFWNKITDLTPPPIQIIFIFIMTPALVFFGFLYFVYSMTSGIISAIIRGLFSASQENKAPAIAGNFLAISLFIYFISTNQHVIYITKNPSEFLVGYILYSLILIIVSIIYILIMLVLGSIIGYALDSGVGRTFLFLFVAFIIFSVVSNSLSSGGDCWVAVGRSGLVCE
jgi:hypothetical protein